MAARISRYFDHAATTPMDLRVLEEMLPYLREEFGNPNSLHSLGRFAQHGVDLARERLARAIGAADPSQITFVSGASEANNWILRAFPGARVSPFEHSSLWEGAAALGYRLLQNREHEILPPDEVCPLVSVMHVNNETGQMWDAAALKGRAERVHSDLTQAVGKVPISLDGLDFASLSAHKFYGPKGVGALYSADLPPEPMLFGGEQEMGFRAGTLNVAAIVGMGLAAELAAENQQADFENALGHRQILLDGLAGVSDWQLNGSEPSSPFILNLGFWGVQGETLVLELDASGFALSSGAACSSRSTEPSRVLTALGLQEGWVRGALRVSFGRTTESGEVEKLSKMISASLEKIRTMS